MARSRAALQNLVWEAVLSYRSPASLLLVGLVEEDSRFGAVLADLQAPLPHRRPTLEFMSRAMADDPGSGPGTDPLDPPRYAGSCWPPALSKC